MKSDRALMQRAFGLGRAIALAQAGGIGVIHRNMTPAEQAHALEKGWAEMNSPVMRSST